MSLVGSIFFASTSMDTVHCMDIYSYMLTYGGPQLLFCFTLFFVTPLYNAWLKQRVRTRIRYTRVLALWMASIVVGYWDVMWIAFQARELCATQAGMFVYETAIVKSFAGDSEIEYWSQKGFRFLEDESAGRGQKYRYEMVEGKRVATAIEEFASVYKLIHESSLVSAHVKKSRDVIMRTTDGRVIGEIVEFRFYPGWLDSRLLGFIGFSWTSPACDDDYPPRQASSRHYVTELIAETLIPAKEEI